MALYFGVVAQHSFFFVFVKMLCRPTRGMLQTHVCQWLGPDLNHIFLDSMKRWNSNIKFDQIQRRSEDSYRFGAGPGAALNSGIDHTARGFGAWIAPLSFPSQPMMSFQRRRLGWTRPILQSCWMKKFLPLTTSQWFSRWWTKEFSPIARLAGCLVRAGQNQSCVRASHCCIGLCCSKSNSNCEVCCLVRAWRMLWFQEI